MEACPCKSRTDRADVARENGMITVCLRLLSGREAEVRIHRADRVSELLAEARKAFGAHVVLCSSKGHRLAPGAIVVDTGLQDGDILTAVATRLAVVVATDRAFAHVNSNGSVVTWGASDKGGDSSSVDLSTGVESAMCGNYACVAVITVAIALALT